MAKERIHVAVRLSRAAFEKFLKSSPRRMFVAVECEECPIAKFMGPDGWCDGTNYGTYGWPDAKLMREEVIRRPLPPWARSFVCLFDAIEGRASAKRALEIYKKV